MSTAQTSGPLAGRAEPDLRWSLWSLPLAPLQPLLGHIVTRVTLANPEIFDRLGPHRHALFVIDPIDLPFALMLRLDPDRLLLRAGARPDLPEPEARIAGRLLDLVRLVDCEDDGDAMFFSRDLTISGDTEAVVCLRNALDNIEGSLASGVADLLGPPGRLALSLLRRAGGWQPRAETRPT